MTSQVDVCNMALARIGSRNTIGTLTEASPEAQFCATFYSLALDAALASFDWGFATASALLAQTGTPPPQWLYQYAIPDDCVRARGLRSSTAIDPTTSPWLGLPGQESPDVGPVVDFERGYGVVAGVAGRVPVLWTNLAAAQLDYTARVDNPTVWEPLFVAVVAWRLAMELAIPLTGSGGVMQAMTSGLAASLAQAMPASRNTGVVIDTHIPDWLKVRG